MYIYQCSLIQNAHYIQSGLVFRKENLLFILLCIRASFPHNHSTTCFSCVYHCSPTELTPTIWSLEDVGYTAQR